MAATTSGDRWAPEEVTEATAVSLEAVVMTGFEHLPVFSIRNGDVGSAKSMLVRPTISEMYHWAPVGGVDERTAIRCIDGFIRCAMFQLTKGNDTKLPTAQARKVAIVLGTARAVMTTYFEVTPNDLIGGEKAKTYLNMVVDGEGRITYKVTNAAGTGDLSALTGDLGLTTTEIDVISVLLTSSIGIIPLQGFSLMHTGHHYLSQEQNQSRKAYAAVERQFWKSSSVAEWFSSDLTVIQDACWHKAGHPVSLTLKEMAASNQKVAEMLVAAGAGSAAARLPALEPALRAANSYIALFKTVGPLLRMFQGDMSMGSFPDIVKAVADWPPGVVRAPSEVPIVMPAEISTRAEGVAYVAELISRNQGVAGFCYGFYCALSEANSLMATSGTTDTLKTSNSLSKLKNQTLATYIAGSLAYQDFAAARARDRSEGKFVAPTYKFDLGAGSGGSA